jgi:hypothetical protein
MLRVLCTISVTSPSYFDNNKNLKRFWFKPALMTIEACMTTLSSLYTKQVEKKVKKRKEEERQAKVVKVGDGKKGRGQRKKRCRRE